MQIKFQFLCIMLNKRSRFVSFLFLETKNRKGWKICINKKYLKHFHKRRREADRQTERLDWENIYSPNLYWVEASEYSCTITFCMVMWFLHYIQPNFCQRIDWAELPKCQSELSHITKIGPHQNSHLFSELELNAHIQFWLTQPVMSTYLHRFPQVFSKD